jgi:hypothetical protein
LQRIARSSLTLMLSLALAFGSVTQAIAHLGHGAGTLVELCIDGTAQRVMIGPNGDPQSSQGHDCNSCVRSAALHAPTPTTPGQFRPIARAAQFLPRVWHSQNGPVLPAPNARAPPVAV